MTSEELRALIDGDAQATSAKDAGDWHACATRCREIAPRQIVPHLVAELGVVAAYAEPRDAITVLTTIDTLATSNPMIAIAKRWMAPGAPGIDIGDARTRAMLTTPVDQGGIGLSNELSRPLLALAEREPEITAKEIQAAYGRDLSAFAVGDRVRVKSPFDAAFPGEYSVDYIMPDGTCLIDGDRSFAPEYLEAV